MEQVSDKNKKEEEKNLSGGFEPDALTTGMLMEGALSNIPKESLEEAPVEATGVEAVVEAVKTGIEAAGNALEAVGEGVGKVAEAIGEMLSGL